MGDVSVIGFQGLGMDDWVSGIRDSLERVIMGDESPNLLRVFEELRFLQILFGRVDVISLNGHVSLKRTQNRHVSRA